MKKIKMDGTSIEQLMLKIKQDLEQRRDLPDKIDFTVNPSITLTEDQKVEVIFENDASRKMDALIDSCEKEIGWYATVMRENEKRFIIKDIIVFPQTVTGATVTTDDLEYSAWMESLDDETFNSLRFYGHSHVRMTCTPSGVDTAHFSNMLQNLRDFYIFGIFNKRGEYWMNIYDVENNTLYENKDIIYKYFVTEYSKWADEQIKNLVKEKSYTYATPQSGKSYPGSNVYYNQGKSNQNVNKPANKGQHGSWYEGWDGEYYE